MSRPFVDPLRDAVGLGDLFDTRRAGVVLWGERRPGGLVVARAELACPHDGGWTTGEAGWSGRSSTGVRLSAGQLRQALAGAPLHRLEP